LSRRNNFQHCGFQSSAFYNYSLMSSAATGSVKNAKPPMDAVMSVIQVIMVFMICSLNVSECGLHRKNCAGPP
jgi:hypothetical protein